MRSEYDFLLTFSQRLRRAAKISAVAGAVLAGAVSTALVIGVPLQLRSSIETTVSAATNSPAADPSQKPLKEAADAAVETTGGVKTALARLSARNDGENQSTASVSAPTPASSEKTLPPGATVSRLTLAEPAPARSDPAPVLSPAQPSREAAVSSVRLPPGPVAQSPGPGPTVARARAERSASAAPRMPDRATPPPGPVRPEPFSIQEFLAAHR